MSFVGPIETLGGKPRWRRLWRVVAGLSVLVLALAVFAWQQGDGDDSTGPLNAIAKAAERTQREPGGRATMHTIVSSPARSESFTITGQIVFDSETGRSRAIMTMPNPDSDGSVKMEVVGDGTVIYMRSSMFGSLPEGREWMSLDFSLGDELNTPLPANSDAKGELELLEAVTGDVQKLGKEDVHGVPTMRYRGTVDVSENVERLQEVGAENLASVVERKGEPLQVEAWIDAGGRVRRMRVVSSQPRQKGEGSTTTDMRMDFFDFGSVPEIDVPDSSDVFDATSMAQDKLGISSDE